LVTCVSSSCFHTGGTNSSQSTERKMLDSSSNAPGLSGLIEIRLVTGYDSIQLAWSVSTTTNLPVRTARSISIGTPTDEVPRGNTASAASATASAYRLIIPKLGLITESRSTANASPGSNTTSNTDRITSCTRPMNSIMGTSDDAMVA